LQPRNYPVATDCHKHVEEAGPGGLAGNHGADKLAAYVGLTPLNIPVLIKSGWGALNVLGKIPCGQCLSKHFGL